MVWIRIDDHYDENPKIARAGPLAIPVWLAGLAYCNRNLTDGFIPWTISRTLVNWRFIDVDDDSTLPYVYGVAVIQDGNQRDSVVEPSWVIDRLVASGLWERVNDGYRVHDYAQYQPSRADVLHEREKNVERQTRHRSHVNGVTNAVIHEQSNDVIEPVSNGVSNASNNGRVTAYPGPGPGPYVPSTNVEGTPTGVGESVRKRRATRDIATRQTQTTLSIIGPNDRPPRPDRLMWDALLEAGMTEPRTKSERGRMNHAIKELLDAGETHLTIGDVARTYEERMPRCEFTATALAANLSRLKTPRRHQGDEDSRYVSEDRRQAKRDADAAWIARNVGDVV